MIFRRESTLHNGVYTIAIEKLASIEIFEYLILVDYTTSV